MQLLYLTGRAAELKESVVRRAHDALASSEDVLLCIVPDQYTLQTELDLLSGYESAGSFRLQVLSPARLCSRIFGQAGTPIQARVDEQGRVILMQLAAQRERKRLAWYAQAVDRVGFAERAVRQIDQFKQSRLSPEAVRDMAERESDPSTQKKLSDIALLYAAYEEAIAGKFMDGEDEMQRAIARMPDAPFLRDSRVIVYGFDTVNPPLARLILAMSAYARQVTLALVLENDEQARDIAIYESAARSLKRLDALARSQGISTEYVRVPARVPDPLSARAHLARELFAIPSRPFTGAIRDAQAATLSSIAEEAAFAAALAHRLVRTKHWRYRDIMLACPTLNGDYESALRRAFRLYDVPLFLASGRPADRHPLSRSLLTALRLLTRGWQTEDMCAYLRSGFTRLTDDDVDLLVNYAKTYGIRGRGWTSAFARGTQEECEKMEPLRARAVAEVVELDTALRVTDATREKLRAIFLFLQRIDAASTLEREGRALAELHLYESAAEGAQVWNRIVAALDQLADFLPETNVPVREISSLLMRALGATVVKSLPQSSDAVEGAGVAHVTPRAVKALILMGMSAETAPESDCLLDYRELRSLSEKNNIFLGLTREDLGRVNRVRLKALLALPEEYIAVTRPINDEKGDAVQAGRLMGEIERILPGLHARGGIVADEGIERMLLESKEAAPLRLTRLLASDGALAREVQDAFAALPDRSETLARVERAWTFRVESEAIAPDAARSAYGRLDAISASRLEQYAQCPFRHFVRYALHPEPFEELALTPIDRGNFFHAALERFVGENRVELGRMTREESERRMDEITRCLVTQLTENKARESAVCRAQVRALTDVARYAAATVVGHMRKSLFTPLEPERAIEPNVPLDDTRRLAGRIDRVDVWDGDEARYVRVIDYKTGAKTLTLADIYYGVQIQLMVYLAAAARDQHALPAGAFYFGVDEPIVATNVRDAAQVEKVRAKEVRMDGVVLGDEDVLEAMSGAPETAIRLQMGANGPRSVSGKVVTQAQLDALIGHTLSIARDAVGEIVRGDTRISPMRSADRDACATCDYGVMCQFDERVPGACARAYAKLNASEVLERVAQESKARDGAY